MHLSEINAATTPEIPVGSMLLIVENVSLKNLTVAWSFLMAAYPLEVTFS